MQPTPETLAKEHTSRGDRALDQPLRTFPRVGPVPILAGHGSSDADRLRPRRPTTATPPAYCARQMDSLTATELEAMSWRLASDVVRRHPDRARLIRGHPGGGQSDVLWILSADGGPGDIRLNRQGTIQVHGRFAGRGPVDWEPTEWEEYQAADPRRLVQRLESAAGLKVPSRARPATPASLTYRVLARLAASASRECWRIEIQEGFIDTSGYDGGPNRVLSAFPIPDELLSVRDDDLYGEPGYRFWIVIRDDEPVLAFEQTTALAWVVGRSNPFDLMGLYRGSTRRVGAVAARLLGGIEDR